jgi:hypothetical protein
MLAPEVVKYKIPLAHWTKANAPAVVTVAVPAVIVHTPAPMLVIRRVSPAVNNDVFTVIVVADAEFIVMVVPASTATSVYEAVLALTVWLYWLACSEVIWAAVSTCPVVNVCFAMVTPRLVSYASP